MIGAKKKKKAFSFKSSSLFPPLFSFCFWHCFFQFTGKKRSADIQGHGQVNNDLEVVRLQWVTMLLCFSECRLGSSGTRSRDGLFWRRVCPGRGTAHSVQFVVQNMLLLCGVAYHMDSDNGFLWTFAITTSGQHNHRENTSEKKKSRGVAAWPQLCFYGVRRGSAIIWIFCCYFTLQRRSKMPQQFLHVWD